MFKVNDYVMYGGTGICQIADMIKDEHSGSDYYILLPIDDRNLTIKTPVNNPKVMMRPLLTKDEALSLIASIPQQKTLAVIDKKERNSIFKAALKSGDDVELIKVIKTLYQEKQAKSAVNKTLTKTDEDFMKAAEKQLNGEFAIALNIAPDEVLPYILEYIASNEGQNFSTRNC